MDFRDALRRRSDGYWELLATAAGAPEAVERTVRGLTAQELDRGAHGLALAPSLVEERVEALAAHDVGRLVELAREWTAPSAMDDHPWWQAAWRTSLRHLKDAGAISRQDVEAPWLEGEVAVLWDEPAESLSWREIGRAHV